jgi:putative transposase
MQEHGNDFPIEKMAKTLGVSRCGYYEFVRRKPSKRKMRRKDLLEKIQQAFLESRKTYGSPKVHQALKKQSIECSRKLVAKIMRKEKIQPKMRKKWKTHKREEPLVEVASNLLDQEFQAEKPGEKLVSDITQVKTGDGWLYVASVMDLFSRKIVGLSMGSNLYASLAIHALDQAICRLGEGKGVLHHSDRGSQYTSKQFKEYADNQGVLLSMSAKGKCYDNAAMESFFHTLKTEHVNLCDFKTREEAEVSIFEYIEVFYNRKRLHSSLNYKSPQEVENAWRAAGNREVA